MRTTHLGVQVKVSHFKTMQDLHYTRIKLDL